MNRKGIERAAKLGHRLDTQTGASLVEVMVAFLILSIGLLGLAMLQAKTLALNTDAYLRSQATLIANELIESMRANPSATYTATSKPAGVCGACTAVQKKADQAIIDWYVAQENLLPPNTSSITQSGSDCEIKMKWKEKNINVEQTWQIIL
jgi:type IV pilus assembly protein PilV